MAIHTKPGKIMERTLRLKNEESFHHWKQKMAQYERQSQKKNKIALLVKDGVNIFVNRLQHIQGVFTQTS